MRFIPWLLIALAVLEVTSVVLMADWLGGGITLLLMLAGAVVGILMLRHIGFSTTLLAAESLHSRGDLSLYQLLWPVRFAVAAVLLLSPGFASDAAALLLMLPVKGTALPGQAPLGGRARQANPADVIEGEYSVRKPGDAGDVPPERLP